MQRTWHTTSYYRKMFIGKNWSEQTGFAGSFSSWVCDFPLGPLPSKPGLGLQCHVPITTSLLWLPTSIEKKHGNLNTVRLISSCFFPRSANIPKAWINSFRIDGRMAKGLMPCNGVPLVDLTWISVQRLGIVCHKAWRINHHDIRAAKW